MRVFLVTLRKLQRRLATWVSLGILVGLLVLIFVAVGATASDAQGPDAVAIRLLLTFPGAYDAILGFIVGLGGLLALIYGAAIAGSEWGWGTLKNAVARGESRSRYWLATFAGITLLVGIGLLIAFGVGIGAGVAGANLAGFATDGIGDRDALLALPEKLARAWVAITTTAAFGFAIATLARSQLAGIGAGVALFFAEQFAGIFFPDVVKYLPFNAASAVLSGAGGFGAGEELTAVLEPDVALLVVAGWLLGSLLVAALFTERAEISG